MDQSPATWQERCFAALAAAARSCTCCVGVSAGSCVLSSRNGPLSAPVLFVAEAPGYRGALRTRVPLCGDRSGADFERLCRAADIDRGRVFVTNAILCHPTTADGRNRRPRTAELRNCRTHLRAQIELVDPALVVALGLVALDALRQIARHSLHFGRDIAVGVPWERRSLMSLYHTSGQTFRRRSFDRQVVDYRAVAQWQRATASAPIEPA